MEPANRILAFKVHWFVFFFPPLPLFILYIVFQILNLFLNYRLISLWLGMALSMQELSSVAKIRTFWRVLIHRVRHALEVA